MDEVKIDQELVRSLLEDQHPDLAGLEIREVGGGWDNMMWRLGDELAVRLPRLTRAPALLRFRTTLAAGSGVAATAAGTDTGTGRRTVRALSGDLDGYEVGGRRTGRPGTDQPAGCRR